jgi:predicted CopG family antitoxin
VAKAKTGGKAVRTTISLNRTVHQWAEDLRKAEGHNSISDLIADLIRRRKEAAAGIVYPEHRDSFTTMEDRPTKPGKKKKPFDPENQ